VNTYANPTRPYSAFELKLVEDIGSYGFRVNSVFADPKAKVPQFSYSIGIQKTCGAPELIIFGMSPTTAHHLVWAYFDLVQQGRPLPPHRRLSGLLDGYSVFLQPACRRQHEQHMLSCNWFYGAGQYRAVQLIYPHPSGPWPWSGNATPRFRWEQPLICPVPPGQSRAALRRRQPLNRQRLHPTTVDSPAE
jgi:Domain of unknown function (DUF4262)